MFWATSLASGIILKRSQQHFIEKFSSVSNGWIVDQEMVTF